MWEENQDKISIVIMVALLAVLVLMMMYSRRVNIKRGYSSFMGTFEGDPSDELDLRINLV